MGRRPGGTRKEGIRKASMLRKAECDVRYFRALHQIRIERLALRGNRGKKTARHKYEDCHPWER